MINLKNVNYKNILKNINLKIEKGEYISLIGSNGSGKTTLANLLSGLLEEQIEGMKIDKKIALVFENPDNQLIGTTVEDDISFGLRNMQLSREVMQRKITQILDELDIFELKKREISSLSGGQKQKVAFASLLVLDFEVYILDEVTTMLDPESKELVLELISKLNKEGKTIIQITHFLEEVKLSKRTIVMKNAQIVYDGDTEKLLENENLLIENRLI
ncbi:MAG: hypothetical protein TYPL_1480 [Candidatus Tyloplasma litorale]|nr:MAG: hypothetical protein TYPL_1480 [Mycoplasmatales bacterium]